jgi:hypothetical protein
MQTSNEVAELFAALATAQGKYTDVVKDKKARIESQKGSYGYAFADLASYIEAIRPALTEAKLAVIQAPAINAGTVTVTTRIVHASGQWVESELTMPVGQQTPQGIGSAITYARRYALAPMLCLAADDDDGEQAERAIKRQTAYTPPQFQAPAPTATQPEPAISQTTFPDQDTPAGPMTPAQLRPWLLEAAGRFANDAPLPEGWRKAIIGHLSRLTGGDAGRHTFLAWAFGVQSSNDLTNGQWHALYSWLDIKQADDQKWYPSDLAVAEIKLAMAALTALAAANTQKPAPRVDWNSISEVVTPEEVNGGSPF